MIPGRSDLKYAKHSSNPIIIQINFPKPAILLLDTGASPNSLKLKIIDDQHESNSSIRLTLSGITDQSVTTLEKIDVVFFDYHTKFHLIPDECYTSYVMLIIPDDFPIHQDGILDVCNRIKGAIKNVIQFKLL